MPLQEFIKILTVPIGLTFEFSSVGITSFAVFLLGTTKSRIIER